MVFPLLQVPGKKFTIDFFEQLFYNRQKRQEVGPMQTQRVDAAIDLKSFYASVECVERGLDPLGAHLVVADRSRTDKTICLAVSPSLKALGVPGRPRLFEVRQQLAQHNALRRDRAPGRRFRGSSWDPAALGADPALAADCIVAPPRMQLYMRYSARIYEIYLRFVAPEDIFAYSVDEVFLDLTHYLRSSGLSPREYVGQMVAAVHRETGITATAGLGPNLYLCKVAMDILAKHAPPDSLGLRIAQLDEAGYRRQLWDHRPITDFWRVGPGIARRLEKCGIRTMGDIARCSRGGPGEFWNEDLLYRLLGVNAELLIDHAWGIEPCTLAQVKAYRPETNSLSSGQVLPTPYPWDKARLAALEMAESLALDMTEKGVCTARLTLTVGYDRESPPGAGPVEQDRYGRTLPRHSHGTQALPCPTASCRLLRQTVGQLWDRLADPALLVRRITLGAFQVVRWEELPPPSGQLSLFDTGEADRDAALLRERRGQEAVVRLRSRYGKNALLRGMNFREGGTARTRNGQVGGHRA